MEKFTPASQSHPSPRPALSPFLYDLGAATNALPLAAVLPEQFHGSPGSIDTSRGEMALMRAVLEDAIHCFQKQRQKSGRRAQRLTQEAEDWLFSDNARWPFSFLNICYVLGIDAGYLRRGLKQWKEAHPRLATSEMPASSPSDDFPIAA